MLTLGIILVAGAVTLPLSFQANADKTIVNNCKIDKQTGKCEFDQTYKSKRGDIKVQNRIDASNILNNNGSGGGGTVDQTARDGVTALQTKDVQQDSATEKVATDAKTALDNFNQSQTKVNENLSATIQQLKTELENAITDIVSGNQSSGGTGNESGNQSGGGTNETGGNQTNNGTIPTGFSFNHNDLTKFYVPVHTRGR